MTKTYREQRRLYWGEYYIILCSAHKKQVQLYYDTNNIGTRKIALLFLLVILIDLTRHLQLSNVKAVVKYVGGFWPIGVFFAGYRSFFFVPSRQTQTKARL